MAADVSAGGGRKHAIMTALAEDKENIAPQLAAGSGSSVLMTPASKTTGQSGRNIMSTPSSISKTSASCTPLIDRGSLPKNVEEWYRMLIDMPTGTPLEITRIKKVYERALGSGEGCEELDVSSHKDNDIYISLWLRRIRLDPDEGSSYTKFMRTWHIGSKCAAVYIQRALFAPEKAAKTLQEGIDSGAKPADLLANLQKRLTQHQQLEEACREELRNEAYHSVRMMLGTGIPKDVCAAPEDTVQFGRKMTKEAAHVAHHQTPSDMKGKDDSCANGAADESDRMADKKGTAASRSREETVSFGKRLTEAAEPAPTDQASRRSTRSTATSKEETVVFGTHMHSGGKPASAKEGTQQQAAKRPVGLRSIKRTGLGSGPARRVAAVDESLSQLKETEAEGQDEEGSHETRPNNTAESHTHDSHTLSSSASNQDSPRSCKPAGGRKILGHAQNSSLSGAGCTVVDVATHQLSPASSSGSELAPINEGEGALSGSEANSSISSGGSNDSVNKTGSHSSDGAIAISDFTTKPLPPTAISIADAPTCPLQAGCFMASSEDDDSCVEVPLCRSSKQARETVLCAGHTAVYDQKTLPKGFIAVCDKIYQKIETKGQGGGGKVYKVHLQGNPRSIWAIKKIELQPGNDDLRESVMNEIELLIQLRGHSSIIHMEDYEIGDKYVYMVMECGEQDLANALAKKQVKSLRGVWKAMLEAVQVVHEQRVIHGDLKPPNFLMVHGKLKLIDFGIAKQIESNDTTNVMRDNAVGTLNYMAPEAFQEGQGFYKGRKANDGGAAIKFGRPSDVWSLGCILYQMVYGKLPFSDIKTQMQKIEAISNPNHRIEFPPVGQTGLIETELLDILRSTLNRDATKRPTIPQLLLHPWLDVNYRYSLDSYNLLVLVARVREMHNKNKDLTDAEIKEELSRLLEIAGLAQTVPSKASAPQAVAKPSAVPAQPASVATRPPAPPPAPPAAPAPPPPPPPKNAAMPVQAMKAANVATGAKLSLADIDKGAAALRSVGAAPKAAPSNSLAAVPSMADLVAQKNKLRKVPANLEQKPSAGNDANDMAGMLRQGLQHIRSRVAQDYTKKQESDFTGEFTSEFTDTM